MIFSRRSSGAANDSSPLSSLSSELVDGFKDEHPANIFYTCLELQSKGEVRIKQEDVLNCTDLFLEK